ncbi:MAG TPA: TadE family protein [Bryobacteraceae bacterium]|nr:TadE family protein [Bryobacteraceae bacterium]
MTSNRDRRRSERGSVIVELSLIGLIFAVLVIGIMDFAQFLFYQQALLERVRSAARWGAVTDPTNTAAIADMVLYSQPADPGGGVSASFGLTPSMVSVTTQDAGTDDYRLIVQVSGYSFRVLSPVLAGKYFGAPIRISVPLGLYQ